VLSVQRKASKIERKHIKALGTKERKILTFVERKAHELLDAPKENTKTLNVQYEMSISIHTVISKGASSTFTFLQR
jgi:hypothetical protein